MQETGQGKNERDTGPDNPHEGHEGDAAEKIILSVTTALSGMVVGLLLGGYITTGIAACLSVIAGIFIGWYARELAR